MLILVGILLYIAGGFVVIRLFQEIGGVCLMLIGDGFPVIGTSLFIVIWLMWPLYLALKAWVKLVMVK